jgi:D-amino-acid oxidase
VNGPPEIIVVGAGVIGLTVALRLREAGQRVALWARDLPHATTSNVAAAVWLPYRAFPLDKVMAWAEYSYAIFRHLADVPGSGVSVRSGIEVYEHPAEPPWWTAAVPGVRRAQPDELPDGYVDGFTFETPVIEMPIYLSYLLRRFEQAGGRLEVRSLTSLEEPLELAATVVNCTGLGARELARDPEVYAIRGQIVRVAPREGRGFLMAEGETRGLTYVVSRGDGCILGGTADIGDERLSPDPAIAEQILARCYAAEPGLRGLPILEHKVGLRPGRPSVRLEAEQLPGGRRVIHNYGHGGAGVTLSWGCADAACALISS